MKTAKKILIITVIVLIIIQFIQPSHDTTAAISPNDISTVVSIPDNVRFLMKAACYDCHSNNTVYPWYSYFQPIGWLLSDHIRKGRKDLNFSEFADYSVRRKQSRMEEIAEVVGKDEMPLSSYRIMHKNANLSPEQKELIINWANQTKELVSDK